MVSEMLPGMVGCGGTPVGTFSSRNRTPLGVWTAHPLNLRSPNLARNLLRGASQLAFLEAPER